MSTKIDVINAAYQELRISGLTAAPSPANIQMALNRLEWMMAELFQQWNLNIGYNFEATPATTSQTNVPLPYMNMMVTNLACRLIAAFNKEVPANLQLQAQQSLSNSIGMVAQDNMRMIQPPRRMPLGNGNTFRGIGTFWNRFSLPTVNAPVSSSTNNIYQGETLDYFEDFSAFLGTATISSFTIVADPLLTIDSSAISGRRIIYTITAPTSVSGEGRFQQVQIEMTDSTGRAVIRNIDFEVLTPPEVGS